MNYFQYQGYMGTIEPDADNNTLFGKLFGIRQLVTYEGDTMPELRQAFENSVDDYLAYCSEHGIVPDKPCKGSFNVRVGAELHAKALLKAQTMNTNLNNFVKTAIQEKLAQKQE